MARIPRILSAFALAANVCVRSRLAQVTASRSMPATSQTITNAVWTFSSVVSKRAVFPRCSFASEQNLAACLQAIVGSEQNLETTEARRLRGRVTDIVSESLRRSPLLPGGTCILLHLKLCLELFGEAQLNARTWEYLDMAVWQKRTLQQQSAPTSSAELSVFC